MVSYTQLLEECQDFDECNCDYLQRLLHWFGVYSMPSQTYACRALNVLYNKQSNLFKEFTNQE